VIIHSDVNIIPFATKVKNEKTLVAALAATVIGLFVLDSLCWRGSGN
jgi:hypothetical protein